KDHSDAAAKTQDVEQEFRTEKNKQAKTAETEKHVAPIPTLPSAGKAASAPVVPENEDLIVKEEGQAPVSEPRVASEPAAVPEPQRQAEKLNERRDEVAPSAIGDYRSTRTYVYEATKEGLKKRQVLPQNKSMAVVSPPERQMVSELRFVSNARTVLVHLKAPTGEPARVTFSRDKNVQLPESFAVEIITQDSLKLEMNWFATPGFLQVNPAGMRIEILNGETMKIFVSEEFVYQIELSNNPTKAFLVK
ncbi:MAG TPA: hypothetical protein VGA99_15005, partial [bacterium]